MEIKLSSLLKRHSFTLVELSIVLVVMSMLIAVILGVQKIKQLAIVNMIVSDQAQYRKAIVSFQEIYGALPGDFADAQYQLSDNNNIKNNNLSFITKAMGEYEPLNGNNNNKIELGLNSVTFSDETTYKSEIFGLWAHLYNADILIERMSNIRYDGVTNAKVGYNIPSTKKSIGHNMGYSVFYPADPSTHGAILANPIVENHHIMELAEYSIQIDERGIGKAISSDIMQLLDMKVDDGLPFEGSVLALNGSLAGSSSCHNGFDDTYAPDIYYESSQLPSCIAVFVLSEY